MPQHICQVCHQNPATIHEYVVAEKRDNHICEECFRKLQKQPSEPQAQMGQIDLLQKLFLSGAWGVKSKARKDQACTTCGMTLSEFKRRGQLGCETCYQTFKKPLESLLESIHDATRHRGGQPSASSRAQTSPARLQQQLAALRQDLERVIKAERYEEAARIRDEIHRLEVESKGASPAPPTEER